MSWFENAIASISPAWAYKREVSRQKLQKRKYAAAKSPRSIGDWLPSYQNINKEIEESEPYVRNRIRQLVRDFPFFSRAVNIICNYWIGSGLKYQARVKNQNGGLNKRTNQKLEDAFNFWADEADTAGKLHFYEIMRLACRQECESGEYIIRKVNLKNKKRFIPYSLQLIESEWLDTSLYYKPEKPIDNILIEQGIEYNNMTGEVLAYHLVNPDDWKISERVPADQIIHHFQFTRPAQIRGISFMSAAVLTAKIVGQYINAELDAASMASKWLAFVSSPDIDYLQQDRVDSNNLENIENAIIDYLRPGEQINFASHNRPSGSFEPFVKFILRMIAVATGVPYDLLSGDSTDQNYTTIRSVRNDFSKDIEPHTERYRYHFCKPILKDVFDQAVLLDKIKLPGYFYNPYAFYRARWMHSGLMPVDPLKEGKADIDGLQAKTLSLQDILAKRGKDLEEHLDEIEFAMHEMKKRGIESEDVSTAIASNPAELEEE